jgi:nucleotide-binding universal stress UspA family protein
VSAVSLTVRRVLFPTDFSDASRAAGATAAAVARQFGAELTVLYVVPPVTDPSPSKGLAALAAELDQGVAVKTEVASGIPARRIVAYARQHDIDLIVMGTHGRTGLSRALLGSVTEAVVRRAPCRVMVVPATPAEAERASEQLEAGATCIVCRVASTDLVCEPCRARIRGEALERKRKAERTTSGA